MPNDYYTVQPGDTLGAIARDRFDGVSIDQLTGYSSGNPDLIRPGERIRLLNPLNSGTSTGSAPGQLGSTGQPGGNIANDLIARANQFINQNQQSDVALNDPNTPPLRGQQGGSANTSLTQGFLGLLSGGTQPARPNLVDFYREQREDANIEGLQNEINTYDQQIRQILSDVDTGIESAEGRPVDSSVVQGQVERLTVEEQRQLDRINRVRQDAVNRLNNANQSIQTILQYTQLDYQNAQAEYQNKFNQQIQLFNVFNDERVRIEERANEIADREDDQAFQLALEDQRQIQRNKDNARANLNIIYGAVQAGGLDLASADDVTIQNIRNFELQAGLPVGLHEAISAENPLDEIVSEHERISGGVKYVDVVFRENDGTGAGRLYTKSVVTDGLLNQVAGTQYSFDDYITDLEQERQQSISPSDLPDEERLRLENNYTDELSIITRSRQIANLTDSAKAVIQNPELIDSYSGSQGDEIRNRIIQEISSIGIDTSFLTSETKTKPVLPNPAQQTLVRATSVRDNIVKLTRLLETTQTGPVTGRLRRINPYDEIRQQIDALTTIITPGLARLAGEVGILTDRDIIRYRSTFAGTINTPEAIELLQNQILRSVDESINSNLDFYNALGYDLGDLPNTFNRPDLVEQTTRNTYDTQNQQFRTVDDRYAEYQRRFNGSNNENN